MHKDKHRIGMSNRIIDINFYPVPETKYSNDNHRPLGLGVQGLADVFMLFDLPFDSPEAKELNKQIFETIYYGSVRTSCMLAMDEGPYPTYSGRRKSAPDTFRAASGCWCAPGRLLVFVPRCPFVCF